MSNSDKKLRDGHEQRGEGRNTITTREVLSNEQNECT